MAQPSPRSAVAANVVLHRGFLSPGLCAVISGEMSGTTGSPAAVVDPDGVHQVREDQRRTRTIQLSLSLFEHLVERLRGLIPVLSSQFQLKLADVVGPEALTYDPGDFFGSHRDRADNQRLSGSLAERLLSAVMFLNDWSPVGEGESGFSGGVLKLYPSGTSPMSLGRALPICGEAGTLVIFPSEMFHEISVVTRGRRQSLVAFFVGPGEAHVSVGGR